MSNLLSPNKKMPEYQVFLDMGNNNDTWTITFNIITLNIVAASFDLHIGPVKK